MILVDTSVWIDYFNGVPTRETDALDDLLGGQFLATGDLIMAEVLQGFRSDKDHAMALELLSSLVFFELVGRRVALRSAQHHRALRAKGVTVRKTIDTVIATFCIEEGLGLLHSDRDVDPFVEHLGLRVVTA